MADVPKITIEHETETHAGWEHLARVVLPDSSASSHVVRLSFQDYEHWCRGVRAPQDVSRACLLALLTDGGDDTPCPLPERIDAGLTRRWIPDADEKIRARLGV